MKLSWLRKVRYFTAAAATVATVSLIAACGGGTYEAPTSASSTPSWWASYDQSADTAVSGSTVATWIKNGYKTDSGDPVVILDLTTDFTGANDRIIGSTAKASIESFAYYDKRAEGPIDTTASTAGYLPNSSMMVVKGATIDAMIQDLGVTKDTVIVFTTSGALTYLDTRMWWSFYYWGFSETKIKILDGGVAAVKAADSTLVDTTTASVDPTDSTFSVMDLPGLHDSARVSTKDVIDLVKAGATTTKIIDVRPSTASGAVAFNGRIKGAIAPDSTTDWFNQDDITDSTGDYTFIPKATALAALDDASSTAIDADLRKILENVSSTDTIIVHCVTGNVATTIYYYLKEIMGYPNVAVYDGSWSAWSSYAGYEPGTSYASNALYWNSTAFYDSATSSAVDSTIVTLGGILGASTTNQSILAYDTVKLSTNTTTPQTITFNATTNWRDSYGVLLLTVDSSYTGDGNEIEEEDKAYVESNDATETTSTTTSSESTTTSGSTSGGC